MERDSLFYMANLYPEIGRMFAFYDSGKEEAAGNAQKRALDIVNKILDFSDIKSAGREEWSTIRDFIAEYDKLDPYRRVILEKYAAPFSYKFMNSYQSVQN